MIQQPQEPQEPHQVWGYHGVAAAVCGVMIFVFFLPLTWVALLICVMAAVIVEMAIQYHYAANKKNLPAYAAGLGVLQLVIQFIRLTQLGPTLSWPQLVSLMVAIILLTTVVAIMVYRCWQQWWQKVTMR